MKRTVKILLSTIAGAGILLVLSGCNKTELAEAEENQTISSPQVQRYECLHTGSGRDITVGPSQRYASISDVPWETLGPGDTVRIFYREEPYREKIVISGDGTEEEPIRICGVRGPNGERPVLDGDMAKNDPDDQSAYGSYRPMEGLAMVLLWNRDFDRKVHNIVIEGLHIKNAKKTFDYRRMDGSLDRYEEGAACIRVQAGDNIVIRDNELENCGNGIFTMSQEYNEASLTRNILIEGNYLHGHGEAGSYLQHALYIQSIGAIYQFNRFGPNTPGSLGATLKERVAGSVIRYNWFESGSSRVLDLVEVEDAASWYIVDEYLKSLGGARPDPDRLEKVRAAEAAYRKTYVYGNFIDHVGSKTIASSLIHYGYDNDPALARKGTLYFFNNTMSIRQDRSDSWRLRLFDIYLYDETKGTPAEERVELFNNIIYFTNETAGSEAAYLCLGRASGTIDLGVNWISDDWNGSEAMGECYPYAGESPVVNGVSNLIDTSSAEAPIDITTLLPVDTPQVRGRAQAMPSEIDAKYSVRYTYVPHQKGEPRSSVNDLGAAELP